MTKMRDNENKDDSEIAPATLIKVCGITNREDAHAAIEAGADVLGFVAVQESPRYVGALAFQRIRDVLPEDFPVVVVAKRSSDAAKYHAPIVQYYDESELDDGLDASVKRIKVIRIHTADSIADAKAAHEGIHAILLDGFHTTALGGTGTRFDWSLAESLPSEVAKPVILAGGLTPGNVSGALSAVRPYAVDVSSGVEDRTPGKKAHDLVRKFIGAVRSWDSENGRRAIERRRFLS
jgi:phosphoribosylanthranilate isomerase